MSEELVNPEMDPEMDPEIEEFPENVVDGPDGILAEEIQTALEKIVEDVDRQNETIRVLQLQDWKKNLLLFHGYQFLDWDEQIRNFISPQFGEMPNSDPEMAQAVENFTKYYNIFRAHGESIISAMSTGVPLTKFFPKRPDRSEDVVTSRECSHIAEYIQQDNDAVTLMQKQLRALYLYGYYGIYTTHEQSEKYGTVEFPVIESVPTDVSLDVCPSCGSEIPSDSKNMIPEGSDPGIPIGGDILQNCPQCGDAIVPQNVFSGQMNTPQQTDVQIVPKYKERIEIHTPLNLKLPARAKRQSDVNWIILEDEYHYAQVRSIFPKHADKITASGSTAEYERWARHIRPTESVEELVTLRRIWIRPVLFWTVDDKEIRSELFRLFPKGAYLVYSDDIFLEAKVEDLDEHWTLYVSPLAEDITSSDPICKPLVPIQEAVNDLLNYTLQNIQFGIPETFADSRVINKESYQKNSGGPGTITPVVNPTPDQPLGSNFFQLKASTMSREIESFAERLNTMAQFALGDFPSVFGGAMDGSSGTLGEYQESQARALQRLSLPWKILIQTWTKAMEKAVTSYLNHILEDEHFVRQEGDEEITIWIRKANLTGKFGSVRSESSEQFPMTWAQKGAVLHKLLASNLPPEVLMTLFNPQNVGYVSQLFGLTDLKLPGEADKLKQLEEISQMLNGFPVPVDPILDNHEIEYDTCRNWLISSVGMEMKQTMPDIYGLIYQHFMMHGQILAEKAAQELAMQSREEKKDGSGTSGPEKSNPAS